jgi:hypothetical protein
MEKRGSENLQISGERAGLPAKMISFNVLFSNRRFDSRFGELVSGRLCI